MIPENFIALNNDRVQQRDGGEGVVSTAHHAAFPERTDQYSVEVIADTQLVEGDDGSRLTTIVAKFPRCVLSEVNTHRVFSRNSASSRAKSLKTTLIDIMEHPYIPFFTHNRRGMTGLLLSDEEQQVAAERWLEVRDSTVLSLLSMLTGRKFAADTDIRNDYENIIEDYYANVYLADEKPVGSLNIHKQNANRLIEPFQWQEAVISATTWENFLELRDSPEADPAILILGKLVKSALRASQPVFGQVIHAPFARDLASDDLTGYEDALNRSAGASAQVSYRPVGGSGRLVDPQKLANRLLEAKHMSPFEHGAIASSALPDFKQTSNFSSHWTQYRKIVEAGGFKNIL